MNLISAYHTPSERKLWSFEKPRFGLVQELFIPDTNTRISAIVGD